MTKAEKRRRFCPGCRNDYYNHGGNSTTGECWSLAGARVVKRIRMSIHEAPPYDKSRAAPTLNCKSTPHVAYVDPKNIAADGYWKR